MGLFVPEQYGWQWFCYRRWWHIVEVAKVCGQSDWAWLRIIPFAQVIFIIAAVKNKENICPNGKLVKWLVWGLTEPNRKRCGQYEKQPLWKMESDWILNGTKCRIARLVKKVPKVAVVITTVPRWTPLAEWKCHSLGDRKAGTPIYGRREKTNWSMRASEPLKWYLITAAFPIPIVLVRGGAMVSSKASKVLDGGRMFHFASPITGNKLPKALYWSSVKICTGASADLKSAHCFDFKGISFKLADMATEIAAAELLIAKAAPDLKTVAMYPRRLLWQNIMPVKLPWKISNDAVQVFGGCGCTKDFPAEKYIAVTPVMRPRVERRWNSEDCDLPKEQINRVAFLVNPESLSSSFGPCFIQTAYQSPLPKMGNFSVRESRHPASMAAPAMLFRRLVPIKRLMRSCHGRTDYSSYRVLSYRQKAFPVKENAFKNMINKQKLLSYNLLLITLQLHYATFNMLSLLIKLVLGVIEC